MAVVQQVLAEHLFANRRRDEVGSTLDEIDLLALGSIAEEQHAGLAARMQAVDDRQESRAGELAARARAGQLFGRPLQRRRREDPRELGEL
jgi:hypothetical protein